MSVWDRSRDLTHRISFLEHKMCPPDWNLQPRQILPIYLGVFPFNWWSDFIFIFIFIFFFFLSYWILENNKEIAKWSTLKLPMISIDYFLALLQIPNILWADPNVLCLVKNGFTYCANPNLFVSDQKMIVNSAFVPLLVWSK